MRAHATAGVLALLSVSWGLRADVPPSPLHGNVVLRRAIVVDRLMLPDDMTLQYYVSGGKTRGPSKPQSFESQFDVSERTQRVTLVILSEEAAAEGFDVTLGAMGEEPSHPFWELEIPLEQDFEVEASSDSRRSVQRHVRPAFVAGEAELEVLEDRFLDENGAFVCKRARFYIDYGLDPCRPGSVTHLVHNYGVPVSVPAMLLLAGGLLWRRRNRTGG